MTQPHAAIAFAAATSLLIACESTTTTEPQDPAPPDPPSPTWTDQLAGDWTVASATCDGILDEGFLEESTYVLTFDDASLTFTLDEASCAVAIPYEVTYDEAASTIEATPKGTVSCVPAECGELCDTDASALPGFAGAVTVDTDTMTLTGDDSALLPAFSCAQSGLDVPAVYQLAKGRPHREPFDPSAIETDLCDGFDAFAPGRTVYYVAQNQPGADNDACDGLAPTDEGNGRCPFADFDSDRVRKLMFEQDGVRGVRDVTFAIRDGVYTIEPRTLFPSEPDYPLVMRGDTEEQAGTVALVAYPGEAPVLDGSCSTDFPECASPEDPGRIWTLLELHGQRVHVEGLTFDNVHKWNIAVASSHTCVIDNTFFGSYGSDSDSMKSFGGSGPHVIVRGNDFSLGYEQAIDATNARGWLIEDNHFHDAPDRGVGFKYGASGNIVRNNRFTNLGGGAVSLGGTGSAQTFSHTADNIIIENNIAENLGVRFAEVYSCLDCTLRDNTIDGAGLGVVVGDEKGEGGCPGGCALSARLTLEGNRFRGLFGGGEETPPNGFVAIEPAGIEGMVAGNNLYCVEPTGPALFGLGGEIMDHATWSGALMTDETSSVEPVAAANCQW